MAVGLATANRHGDGDAKFSFRKNKVRTMLVIHWSLVTDVTVQESCQASGVLYCGRLIITMAAKGMICRNVCSKSRT